MANKKLPAALILLLLSAVFLRAQWMENLSPFFGPQKDYTGAIAYLISELDKIDEGNKSIAFELLAYCCHKLNDRTNETKWIISYFDTYSGSEPILGFLDESSYADMSSYITSWKIRFPQVTDIAIVGNRLQASSAPPVRLPLVVDITTDAYYRLISLEGIQNGGLFRPGSNSLNIDATHLFDESGTHLYYLDLKSGDLIIRKEINLEIQVEKPFSAPVKPPEPTNPDREYKLSMYVGGRLIVASKKLPNVLPPKIDFPKGTVYLPKFPRDQKDFNLNTFSVLDAVAALYKAIKDLTKGKHEKAPEFKYQKQQQTEISFRRVDSDGLSQEIRSMVRLKTRTLPEFVESVR
jgi:hypothetical protein